MNDKLYRTIWEITRLFLFRPFSGQLFRPWRAFILRLFGAQIATGAHIYASARIRSPRKLSMYPHSCLAEGVICYNVAHVCIGAHATVSQRAHLCTASHDIRQRSHPTISAPIVIRNSAWVAAEAFIGMGVTVGEEAVVGARAAVFRDVPARTVVGGNPAIIISTRTYKS